MKNILLLGGYGFLGSNIMSYIDEKLKDDYQVIVFDKFNEHLGGLKFKCNIKTYAGDFLNHDFLEKIFKENHIDMVIHSLSTVVPANSINPKYDVETNLLPTLDILNLILKYKEKGQINEIPDIVYISSGGAIYGNTGANHLHLETDETCPVSSYGVVKLTIEKYLMLYAAQFGLKPLILRLSNPYGTYHYSNTQGVCNIAMRKAINNEEIEVWGTGDGKKDYIFVKDFVEILFKLTNKNVHNEIINIGSGQTYSVNDITNKIKEIVPNVQIKHIETQKFDVSTFNLNINKLLYYIGNYKFTNINEGFEQTYNWEISKKQK